MPSKNIKEQIDYQHWFLVITLLKQGIPYEVIKSATDSEFELLMGIMGALQQSEQEAMDREQRQNQMKGSI